METVMAEKVETILSRGVYTTRPRDFYDIYILKKTQKYDPMIFKEVIACYGDSFGAHCEKIIDKKSMIEQISVSADLRHSWERHPKKFPYAQGISYEDTIEALKSILSE